MRTKHKTRRVSSCNIKKENNMRYYTSAVNGGVEMIAVDECGGGERVAWARDKKDLPSVPEARKILSDRKARHEAMVVRPPYRPDATEEGYW